MKLINWLDEHFEEAILCFLLVAISCIMGVQLILRNFFGTPIPWSDEICRYMFVWMGGLGVAFATKNASHLRMDILPTMIPALKKPLEVLCDISLVIVGFILIRGSIPFFANLEKTHQLSAAMKIPMKYVYYSMSVGFGLSIFRIVERYVKMFLKLGNQEKKEVQGS